VDQITLSNAQLRVGILTYGAILQSLHLSGVAYDLTLGSDKIADYEGEMMYYGSLVAPIVNRFTDAKADLAGQTLQFERNFLGKHSLHSGAVGVQHKVWKIEAATQDTVQLALTLPDGEGGFPGLRHVTTRFTLDGATLRMDVTVVSDKPTLWNAANHSYWNLDGTKTYEGHRLQIMADHYLPTDADFVPRGEIRAVTGTEMDFRTAQLIAPHAPPLDNCFCLGRAQTALRPALILTGASGVEMTVSTTEAGIQAYDHRHTPIKGAAYAGLAVEAQNWPDAPNHAGFPDITLHAGQSLTQTTAWHFAQRKKDGH
jgi:aldose 1-epimerase